ncbi:MAG: SH3 domain-containing protein [Prevotellaceae bacterium]|nr:SH3 domain-containing protein [Prevotellaceae bacterium]
MRKFVYFLWLILPFSVFLTGCSNRTEKESADYRTPTTTLNLREGPGTTYGIVKSLLPGENLKVLDSSEEEWIKVETASGAQGYVAEKYTAKADVVSNSAESQYVSAESEQVLHGSGPVVKKREIAHISAYCMLGGLILLILVSMLGSDIWRTISVCVLGIVEIIFCYASNGESLPWFCEPNEVGWIWTCVNFLLLLLLFSVQRKVVSSVLNYHEVGLWRRIILYPLAFFAALGLMAVLKGVNVFAALAIYGVCFGFIYLLLRSDLDDGLENVLATAYITIARGGLLLLMLSNISLIIVGGFAIFVLKGMAEDTPIKKKYIKLDDGVTILDVSNSTSYAHDQFGHPWQRDNVTGKWYRA